MSLEKRLPKKPIVKSKIVALKVAKVTAELLGILGVFILGFAPMLAGAGIGVGIGFAVNATPYGMALGGAVGGSIAGAVSGVGYLVAKSNSVLPPLARIVEKTENFIASPLRPADAIENKIKNLEKQQEL